MLEWLDYKNWSSVLPQVVAPNLLCDAEFDPADPETMFQLKVEGEHFCSVKGLFKAVCALMSVYFSFDLAYPSYRMKSLILIQKELLNLEDKVKTPMKVISVMKRIKDLC